MLATTAAMPVSPSDVSCSHNRGSQQYIVATVRRVYHGPTLRPVLFQRKHSQHSYDKGYHH